jgi:hypothetical protein
MWKKALGILIGLSQIVAATCHGYLVDPRARNVQRNSDYCPHCLNGPGVCGDARGKPYHEAFGKYASPPIISAKYKSGSTVNAKMVITANHLGRWSLELCALKNASPSTERSAIRAGCFKRLSLANGNGPYLYIPSSASSSSGTFRLPKGVKCSRCVVRWVWETSNSCNPQGMPSAYSNPYVGTCRSSPEQFKNCADVTIG